MTAVNTPMPPADREKNRFSARARRYAKVGTQLGGTAARFAGARFFGVPLNRAANALELAAALGGLKGPIMKVAQLLATIPDALPPEYANELIKLQSQAPPMGWAFVKRRMSEELGADWQKKFSQFEHHPTAVAVRHSQTLRSGHRHDRNRCRNRCAPARGAGLFPRGQARRAVSKHAEGRRCDPRAESLARSFDRPPARARLDDRPQAARAQKRSARKPQPACHRDVHGLVVSLQPLRRHSRRPASRQLHGLRQCQG